MNPIQPSQSAADLPAASRASGDDARDAAASISDALDQAVAQLQAAAGRAPGNREPAPRTIDSSPANSSPTRLQYANEPAIAGQHPIDAKATLDLIESMCSSDDRRLAVEKLVRAIAPPGTSSVVRAGLGNSNLKQLFDSRLGWIGTGSALFDQVAATWAGRPSRNTDKLEPDSKVETFTLVEPGIDSDSEKAMTNASRCQVWIHNDSAAIRWIQPVRETLASVLFSRPTRRIPFVSGNGFNSAKAKAWIAGGALLAAVALAWPVHYPVAATVSVETLSGRYVAVPFNARLLEVQVKPGQQVSAGQPLLQLDGRPLRIELETLETELQQAVKEHNAALASRRIADAQQAMLEQKKKQRNIDLVNDRLQRLSVTSPIDGVVLCSDLKRLVGSPLELGQTLIEVAAMDAVAVELEIPEYEIGFISKGMDTRIKIDALGGQSLHLPLDEIYPAAELRNDQNVFVGRVEVANQDGKLRPGMKGKAVAYGPIRPWIWSWVRGAVERMLWTIGY